MKICDEDKCCGCGCCAVVCGQNAIVLKEDRLGQVRPCLDDSKCVKCGLCQKKCPVNHPPALRTPLKVYACYALDSELRENAASGGMASVFYRKMLADGGTIYGTVLDQQGNAFLMGSSSERSIESFRGSKYVKAAMNGVYTEIKERLKRNCSVLFVGTPCQTAALKNYLGAEYDGLVTVDLICHGTPPNTYLKEYLAYIKHKKRVSQVDRVVFREKRGFVFNLVCGGRPVYRAPGHKDIYMHSFLSAMTYCEGCYHCGFAAEKRVADLTIGDFWGLGEQSSYHGTTDKASVVLVNTEKGRRFFQECGGQLYTEEKSMPEATNKNQQLVHPSTKYPQRDRFLQLYETYGFVASVKKTQIYKNIVKNHIKDLFSK